MPDFSLLQTPNFAQAALGGYQAGRQIHQQNERDGALKGYLANPDDPVALRRYAAADPEQGLPLIQQQQKRAQDAHVADLARRAQGGDHDAAMQLWGMDNGLAQHFSAEQQAMVKRGT